MHMALRGERRPAISAATSAPARLIGRGGKRGGWPTPTRTSPSAAPLHVLRQVPPLAHLGTRTIADLEAEGSGAVDTQRQPHRQARAQAADHRPAGDEEHDDYDQLASDTGPQGSVRQPSPGWHFWGQGGRT